MKEERQLKFYRLVGEELTKTRARININLYDLAKKVGEQWNTLRKIEAGGKFMAHQYVWLREIGVDFDVVLARLSEPEVVEEIEVEEGPKPRSKYSHLLEEIDEEESGEEESAEEESLDSLF